MLKPTKPVLGVRIGPASLAKLRQHAAAFEISLGELARRIIDNWLEHRPLANERSGEGPKSAKRTRPKVAH